MGREEGGGFRMGNTCILINFLLKKKKKSCLQISTDGRKRLSLLIHDPIETPLGSKSQIPDALENIPELEE